MRLWVIKMEKAWLRFIQVVSVNCSVQGRITMDRTPNENIVQNHLNITLLNVF